MHSIRNLRFFPLFLTYCVWLGQPKPTTEIDRSMLLAAERTFPFGHCGFPRYWDTHYGTRNQIKRRRRVFLRICTAEHTTMSNHLLRQVSETTGCWHLSSRCEQITRASLPWRHLDEANITILPDRFWSGPFRAIRVISLDRSFLSWCHKLPKYQAWAYLCDWSQHLKWSQL